MTLNMFLLLFVVAEDPGSSPDWITFDSLLTLSGATLGIFLFVNTLGVLLKKIDRWLLYVVLILSFLFSAYMVFATEKVDFPNGLDNLLGQVLLIFLNGLLLFTTSVGANETLNNLAYRNNIVPQAKTKTKVSFISSWLKN